MSEPQRGETAVPATVRIADLVRFFRPFGAIQFRALSPTAYAVGYILFAASRLLSTRTCAGVSILRAASRLAEKAHESGRLEIGNQERRVAASGDSGDALSGGVAAADRAFHGGRPSRGGPVSS